MITLEDLSQNETMIDSGSNLLSSGEDPGQTNFDKNPQLNGIQKQINQEISDLKDSSSTQMVSQILIDPQHPPDPIQEKNQIKEGRTHGKKKSHHHHHHSADDIVNAVARPRSLEAVKKSDSVNFSRRFKSGLHGPENELKEKSRAELNEYYKNQSDQLSLKDTGSSVEPSESLDIKTDTHCTFPNIFWTQN